MINKKDTEIFNLIKEEEFRQENVLEMIASENIVSKQVQEACGSILTNKYAEGYPSKRYYAGCETIDKVESLAIERVKKLFNCKFANVQPHSGASANLAVLFAVCEYFKSKPQNIKIVGMSLDAGGHLTHGAKPTISGKWFQNESYGLDSAGFLDYSAIETSIEKYIYQPATEKNGMVIILGGSAYPRTINYKRIADKINKIPLRADGKKEILLFVDMSHFAGLVAGKQLENPCDFADIVSSTTHKTLRGPRGGIILSNDEQIAILIDKAIFPGCQGGPLEHIIAGKAVCFYEALQPEFQVYAKQIIDNTKVLEAVFRENNIKMLSNGTDTHLILVDLKNQNVMGTEIENILSKTGIICNKNSIFGDTSPFNPSGIRIGTPALTTRGLKEKDMREVGQIIANIIKEKSNGISDDIIVNNHKESVQNICKKFPHYNN